MARRKEKPRKPAQPAPEAPTGAPAPGASDLSGALPTRVRASRVLCAGDCLELVASVRSAAGALGAAFQVVRTLGEARQAIAGGLTDVAVIDATTNEGGALQLVREFATAPDIACRFIVASQRDDLNAAVDAMRCGASDFLLTSASPADLTQRLSAALEQARRRRDEQRKVERLQRICKRLNNARQEVSDQVDTLCNDLVTAYQDLADQMNTATLATEFNALVRQELDVESLLRTTLEFMLTRTGPTNAAVFLPTGHSDYNLGAYVNYDMPRDAADVLLDHLADFVPQRFEDLEDILHMPDARSQEVRLGEHASWLDDSAVLAFACRDEDECLAVVTLFRNRKSPYTDEILAQLEVMRDIFTQQLARVVRIHHRAHTDQEWPGFDVEDDRGMAA